MITINRIVDLLFLKEMHASTRQISMGRAPEFRGSCFADGAYLLKISKTIAGGSPEMRLLGNRYAPGSGRLSRNTWSTQRPRALRFGNSPLNGSSRFPQSARRVRPRAEVGERRLARTDFLEGTKGVPRNGGRK